MRIPRLFRDIPHLGDKTLVLEGISKTLIGYLQVTENGSSFPTTGSGAAQVTCSVPFRGQASRRSSSLNTLAIVSPFLSSAQSVSEINISVVTPSIGVQPCD